MEEYAGTDSAPVTSVTDSSGRFSNGSLSESGVPESLEHATIDSMHAFTVNHANISSKNTFCYRRTKDSQM